MVTAAHDGTLLDRRRVQLVDEGVPVMPYHHDALQLPVEQGVALVERVRVSAERNAARVLDEVAKAVREVRGIALRACPELPPTIAERLKDYRAQNVADWVMYRKALAGAAEARSWRVHWYDTRKVLGAASEALGVESLDAHFREVRKAAGPPWATDHKLAMAASIVAAAR